MAGGAVLGPPALELVHVGGMRGIAIAGGADYLVTSDRRDLLPLKAIRVFGHNVFHVVTPRKYLRLLVR